MQKNPNPKKVPNTTGSLPELVAESISYMIIQNNMEAGSQLPNEFELAQHLNVGRGTVREAVKLLVSKNVLEIRRGKGTFVARHTGQIEDPMGFKFYKDQKKLGMDLLETRLYLEPILARLAAERANEKDKRIILENCRLVEECIHNHEDHLPADMALHVSIARCSHNYVMSKLIPIITYSVRRFGQLNADRLLTQTIAGHREIVDAICNGNGDLAEEAMRKHLEQNRYSLEAVPEKKKKGSNQPEQS